MWKYHVGSRKCKSELSNVVETRGLNLRLHQVKGILWDCKRSPRVRVWERIEPSRGKGMASEVDREGGTPVASGVADLLY